MWATVLVGIVVALSTLAATSITLYAQARRENTAYERSQRDAKSERVRSAYRLALKGADIIAGAAWEDGGPLLEETLDERVGRLHRDFLAGAGMLSQAMIDLILENVSNNVPALAADIARGYSILRSKIHAAHPAGSPVPSEELHQFAAPLEQSIHRLQEAIRAHMAELESPPKPRGPSWPSLRRPRADAPHQDPVPGGGGG